MEVFIILGLFVIGIWTAVRFLFQFVCSFFTRRRQVEPTNHIPNQGRNTRLQQRVGRHRELSKKYRALQAALIQIDQAPDFQRAASLADTARDVPIAARQRQYRRFRPQLVRHFVRRLRAGGDAQILLDSLTTLVEALGIASFEASYIQQEASRQGQRTNRQPTENFSATLERVQREHTDRTAALNQATLNPETKQQLLEAQNQRLVESLMEMTLGNQGDAA